MKEKKWIDCPVCGSKGTMRVQKHLHQRFNTAGYAPIDVEELDGQFCEVCGDGFWSLKSERRITRELREHMAREDAGRIVASELASVPEAAEMLQVSRQAVHKMMNEGRLRYVLTPSLRLPIRQAVERVREEKSGNITKKNAGKRRPSPQSR
jgi:hypothetical protein